VRRILFRFLGHPVYSYPAMLYVGIVLGIYAQLTVAAAEGLNTTRVLIATLILLNGALFGARLLHIVPNWHYYRQNPGRILAFSSGGASMYGGLLLGFPLSIAVLPLLDLPFGAYWDTCSFTMLIGMSVTKFGCLLNGCCAGRATAGWCGTHLSDYRGIALRRIPSQILESLWGIVTMAATALVWGRLPFHGAAFLFALGCYGVGRMVLEPLRDRPDRVAGLSLHRVISGVFVCIAIGGFAAVLL
jgi:phosphatidylglycerol:prolipoprotein diacylglycerol transferase